MTTTPTTWMTKPLGKVRAMLAQSAAFRTLTGSADAAAALAHAHLYVISGYPTRTTPAALVTWAPNFTYERQAQGQSVAWYPSGDIILALCAPKASLDADTPEVDMADRLGSIIDEMTALASDPAYLAIQSISIDTINGPDDEHAHGLSTTLENGITAIAIITWSDDQI